MMGTRPTEKDVDHTDLKARFPEEVQRVVGKLCAALRRVVTATPGAIRHAADLRRALDLDTKVSTQVFRVAMSEQPTAVAMHVPGPPSMTRFFAAARRVGIDEATVLPAEAAYAQFLGFVTASAGDRISFDSMASSLVPNHGDDDAIAVDHRKKAFRAMSHLVGMQADVHYRTSILLRNDDGRYDYAQLRLFRQVRKLTPDASVLLYRAVSNRLGDGKTPFQPHRAPIDSAQPHEHGTNFFPEFSSSPVPKVRISDGSAPHSYRADLITDDVGNHGLVDVALGHVDRNVFRSGDSIDTVESYAGVYFPVARLVQDLILPATAAPYDVSATVYANLYEAELTAKDDRQLLSPNAPVSDLGPEIGAIQDKEWPQYSQLVAASLGSLGIARRPHRIYRRVVDYPVLTSLSVISATARF